MSKASTQKKLLSVRHNVRTLSVKCYDEQLPSGLSLIKSIDSSDLEVLAICHDRDTLDDDIWQPSIEKPHYHILCRVSGKTPKHIGTILNLVGVVFRPGIDDNLYKQHGVETVKDFSAFANYLTHDTPESILAGKFQYDVADIVSNLSIEQIENIRAGYLSSDGPFTKVGIRAQRDYDLEAASLPSVHKDFDDWWQSLPFDVRRMDSLKRTCRATFDYNLDLYVQEHPYVNRLCIFLSGLASTGKSYAASLLPNRYVVNGGGTGKFDKLKISHDTLVINDYRSENILNLTDNYIATTYRRNSHNGYFFGNLVIVLSNSSFEDWLADCGANVCEKAVLKAYESRFFICHIDDNFKIQVDSASRRGKPDEIRSRNLHFEHVRKQLQSSIDSYHASLDFGLPSGCHRDDNIDF